MKKILLVFNFVFLTFTCFSQNFSIPDPNFEQALIDLNLDNTSPTDDIDGFMALNIASAVTNLDISNKNISSLSGIENFTNVEWLFANNNNLTEVDLSNNLSLIRLFLVGNDLTELDLSNNTDIERLGCNSNQLTTLILPTSNSSLTELECGMNELTTLDLSNSLLLEEISFQFNDLTSIDFSSNTQLKDIDGFNNLLTSINLDNCDLIEDINFRNNQITTLELEDRPQLLKINLEFNNLNTLTVKNVRSSAWNFNITALNNPNLFCVAVSDPTESETEWTSFDSQVSFSTDCSPSLINIPDPNFEQALIDLNIDTDGVINGQMLESDALGVTDLDVNSYNISDLTGIEFFTDLEVLTAFNNNVSTVDLSQNVELTTIILALNNLTELDLSNHPDLISLSLNGNSIDNLDVSNNLLLTQLFVNENNLTELDVSMLSNLQNLGVAGNDIVELNISQNTNLTTLFCNDNNLVSLVVANGNNVNFTNFEAQDNTELSCIEVDDVAFSNTNWSNAEPQFNFDSQVSFGTDCAPNNDDCIEAQPLTLGDIVAGTTLGATSSASFPSCQEDTIVLIDVWYQFTAPSSGLVTAIASSALNNININIAIYEDCSQVEPIGCDSGTVEVTDLIPGETYYLQLWIGGNPGGRSAQNLNQVGDFTLEVLDSTLSVGENEGLETLTIFPNPAHSKVNIQTNASIHSVVLFDMTGKEVLVEQDINQRDHRLNLEGLSKGLYMVQIKNESSVINKKLLIK